MPQKKWFVEDATGVDQEEWLVKRIQQDGRSRGGAPSVRQYARKLAKEFDTQFPPNQPAKIFKKRKFERWETEGEARKRCEGRGEQCVTWISNHWKSIVDAATGKITEEPQVIVLDEYKPKEKIQRARSARDLYWAENLHIQHTVEAAAKAEGITDRAVIRAKVNAAYTEAFNKDDRKMVYEERSAEEKKLKALERLARRDSATEHEAASGSSGAHQTLLERTRELNNVEYTVYKFITALARQTNVEAVVLFGGLNGSGEPQPFLISNRRDEDMDLAREMLNPSHPGYGAIEAFYDHLQRVFTNTSVGVAETSLRANVNASTETSEVAISTSASGSVAPASNPVFTDPGPSVPNGVIPPSLDAAPIDQTPVMTPRIEPETLHLPGSPPRHPSPNTDREIASPLSTSAILARTPTPMGSPLHQTNLAPFLRPLCQDFRPTSENQPSEHVQESEDMAQQPAQLTLRDGVVPNPSIVATSRRPRSRMARQHKRASEEPQIMNPSPRKTRRERQAEAAKAEIEAEASSSVRTRAQATADAARIASLSGTHSQGLDSRSTEGPSKRRRRAGTRSAL